MKNSVRPRIRILVLTLAAILATGAIATLGWSEFSANAAGRAQSSSRASGASGAQQSASMPETTMNDQTDLAVTVYNSNVALVRDTRELTIPTGEFQLRFSDIAASINPATVHLRPLVQPEKLSVLEQNYEYDLLDPQKLLSKYVGREVTMQHRVQRDNSTAWQEEKATLLADTNGPVWKINGEIVTGLSADSYRFPDVPANLYSTPTLLWTLANGGATHQKVEASYLAGNISWSADYVLNVSRDDATAGIDGWVTLVNNTGTEFRNAHLQLVAGELNRVAPPAVMGGFAKSLRTDEAIAQPMQQESFSEYHLYTLGRTTTISDKESKQVSMLDAAAFPVQKTYIVNGQYYYYRSQMSPGQPARDPVLVYYKFKNSEKSGLGMPLPAGTVRVYQADSHGGALFVGEDRIGHTPKDEDVSIHIGNAFDIVSERKQTDFSKISDHVYEMEYQIVLRNHKETPVTVEVNEPIGGDWQMLSSTFPAKKTAAFAAQFQVPIAKDGEAVLKYRVRVRY
jgi:hypothetical protein